MEYISLDVYVLFITSMDGEEERKQLEESRRNLFGPIIQNKGKSCDITYIQFKRSVDIPKKPLEGGRAEEIGGVAVVVVVEGRRSVKEKDLSDYSILVFYFLFCCQQEGGAEVLVVLDLYSTLLYSDWYARSSVGELINSPPKTTTAGTDEYGLLLFLLLTLIAEYGGNDLLVKQTAAPL